MKCIWALLASLFSAGHLLANTNSTCELGSVAKVHEIAIIGSGPAGLTAAIYAARANLFPVVIEGEQPGGQLTVTGKLENFPGFPDGTHAPELMVAFRRQAEKFGARFYVGEVVRVSVDRRPFLLEMKSGELVWAKTIIVATGAQPRWLGVPNEQRLIGKGVSSCATCDGFFFKNKDIAVVGGGDVALEEAIFLTRFVKKVHVIVRTNKLRASKIMQDRARANPKIQFIWEREVVDILGESELEGVRLRDGASGELVDMQIQGLFVAIGHTPNTSLFQGLLELDGRGYVMVAKGATRTSVPGVFAAGDVADPIYQQAVTASASGCMAAMDAESFLEAP